MNRFLNPFNISIPSSFGTLGPKIDDFFLPEKYLESFFVLLEVFQVEEHSETASISSSSISEKEHHQPSSYKEPEPGFQPQAPMRKKKTSAPEPKQSVKFSYNKVHLNTYFSTKSPKKIQFVAILKGQYFCYNCTFSAQWTHFNYLSSIKVNDRTVTSNCNEAVAVI